jgi:hypothetical protein
MKFGVEYQQKKLVKENNNKIAFIVGSIESGKNGVGDYTRILAKDLMSENFEILIISINEPIKKPTNKKIDEIELLQIPSEYNYVSKIKLLKYHLDKFNPNWVSIQFVPFAFHKKGIPLLFFRKLTFIRKYKIHFMFHEIWAGNYRIYKLSDLYLGLIQKLCVYYILLLLKPNLINTNLSFFQSKLKKFKPELLPIFGNIPNNYEKKRFIEIDSSKINIILFGGLSKDLLGFEKQLLFLFRLFPSNGHLVTFHFVGIQNNLLPQYLELIDVYFSKNNTIEWGFLHEDIISTILQQAQLGISRAPLELAGKSGSTIAMLEHGLPVLLKPSKNNTIQNFPEIEAYSDLLFFPNFGNIVLPKKSNCTNQRISLIKNLAQNLNEK